MLDKRLKRIVFMFEKIYSAKTRRLVFKKHEKREISFQGRYIKNILDYAVKPPSIDKAPDRNFTITVNLYFLSVTEVNIFVMTCSEFREPGALTRNVGGRTAVEKPKMFFVLNIERTKITSG